MRSISELTHEVELRAALASRFNELIASRGMSQSEAVAKIGTTQPEISQIRRFKLRNISVGRLLQALVALEEHIDILVCPSEQRTSPGLRGAA
jgi:predicted XRE-type DNA-binding protein